MNLLPKVLPASPLFFAGALFLAGCATRQLVPVADGGMMDLQQRSVTRTDDDVVITVSGSAWKGEPVWLEGVVTPIYAVIENRGATSISFGYGDLLIFDEQRAQYPALSPESVATRVQALGHHYAAPPPPPTIILGRPWLWHWPPWYDPWPSPPRVNVSEVYAKALPVGSVSPHSHVQGFIYFAPLPTTVERIIILLRYERSGEPGKREMGFPFHFETSR